MIPAALLAFGAALTVTPMLAIWARRRRLLDVPNQRSSHAVATPRIGGVALVLGFLIGGALLQWSSGRIGSEALIVLCGALAIAVLGLLDDVRQLPALVRLAVQTMTGVAIVAAVGPATLLYPLGGPLVAAALTVFWIVAVTNAYNFMDGIDGIAGTQAIVAGTAWFVVGGVAGWEDAAAVGLLLAAASAGFLVHNWHPAKVFMGDAGSGFLGLLFASIPLLTPAGRVEASWVAILVLWPFLFDTAFTLIRRARRGENVLTAHRSHLYQRLVQTGRSHRYVTVVYAGLALLGAFAAVALVHGRASASVGISIGILIAGIGLWWVVASREAAGVASSSAIGPRRP